MLFSARRFAEICEKLRDRVEKFHKENPLVPGIAREELRGILGKRVSGRNIPKRDQRIGAAGKNRRAGRFDQEAGHGSDADGRRDQGKKTDHAGISEGGTDGTDGKRGVVAIVDRKPKCGENFADPVARESHWFVCLPS